MVLCIQNERGQGGLEPPTSRTRSENHTSRPLALATLLQKILEPGIEPGTYCVLGSRHNQLDHSSLKSILGGTRTHNLEIRSLTPYPLGHEDMLVVTIVRTWGTKPRQGRSERQNEVPRVGFEPTHSFEYLNLSQAP